ncbi:MAG: type II toxin-antitoxin system VapC family toxin [Candidatus Solibacter usitatus]|nr:type II toxin-antitoxin system VapC family toxin [Candidatus Solibacter usitatus]
MFALDTNAIIHYFKGMGRVAAQLIKTSPADIAIPSIVLYELEYGVRKSQKPGARGAQLQHLIDCITLLPFDDASARAAAGIREQLEKLGTPIGPLDVLIAGTAMAHRCTLVTNNTKEFERVRGLHIEDWF